MSDYSRGQSKATRFAEFHKVPPENRGIDSFHGEELNGIMIKNI